MRSGLAFRGGEVSRGSARAPSGLGCCSARAPPAPPLGWDCAPFGLGCCDARAPHAPPLRPPCAPPARPLGWNCAPYAPLMRPLWAGMLRARSALALRSLCARFALRAPRAERARRGPGSALLAQTPPNTRAQW